MLALIVAGAADLRRPSFQMGAAEFRELIALPDLGEAPVVLQRRTDLVGVRVADGTTRMSEAT